MRTAAPMILRAAVLAGAEDIVNAPCVPKPANLEDSYLLYLEALRVTETSSGVQVAGHWLGDDLAAPCAATEPFEHSARHFGEHRPFG